MPTQVEAFRDRSSESRMGIEFLFQGEAERLDEMKPPRLPDSFFLPVFQWIFGSSRAT